MGEGIILYDPKEVNLIVGGVVITGFSEDSMIAVERMEDTFTEYVGVKGEVSMAENANETGEITVTLAGTSPSIPYLTRLGLAKGQGAIVPTQVIDLNTNATSATSNDSRVRKPAPAERGKEVGEREFTIFCGHLDIR